MQSLNTSFIARFLLLPLLAMAGLRYEGKAGMHPDPPVAKPVTITIESYPGAPGDSVSCVLPFSRAGNLILLRAKVDSTEGSFILDTGSPHLVLNITYFRQYPSVQVMDQEEGSMTSTGVPVLQTEIKQLALGSVNYERLTANLVNLGHIENSKGVKVFGLLGMELFRQFEMIIDYDKNLIYLHRITKKEENSYQHEMLNDTSAYRTFPVDIIKNRVLAKTEIAGKKLRLLIDFAAESNVLDSRLPDKIFENVSITRRVVLTGVGNRKVEALFGDLSNLKLGDQQINNLPVLITNLEKTCLTYDSCIDGILGFDFLSLHKIGFNFVNHKMYIWK